MNAPSPPDPAYTALKRRSLGVALPAMGGVLLLLALISWKQGLLTATRPLYFMTSSATGISRGMPVKLNGFVVGQVAAIELLPPSAQAERRVRVALDVFRRYLDYVPKTSVARLAQEGLIGQSVIELVPQRYDARSIHGGEMLPFERSRGLAEIAGGLEQRIAPVLDNTRALTEGLADPKGNLQGLLADGRVAVTGLAQTNAEVQRTLVETRVVVASLSEGAQASLRRSERTLAAVERDVPQLLGDLRGTAAQARQASTDVASLTKTAATQVPRILDSAEQAAADGNALVGDVRGMWPLRALARGRETGLAPSDSLDGVDVPLEPAP